MDNVAIDVIDQFLLPSIKVELFLNRLLFLIVFVREPLEDRLEPRCRSFFLFFQGAIFKLVKGATHGLSFIDQFLIPGQLFFLILLGRDHHWLCFFCIEIGIGHKKIFLIFDFFPGSR